MIIKIRSSVTPLLGLLCLLLGNLAWASNEIHIAAQPQWVVPSSLPGLDNLPREQIENGVYDLLVDTQIKVDSGQEPLFYRHSADYIVNPVGVEHRSQINIGYDPAYQQLQLHSLRIHRGNKVIDKLSSARMKLIQREEEMDELMYNGRLTLNIIVDDVRPGDTLEYSYTRRGMNPVYQNIFTYIDYLNWTVPVGKVSLRLLWNKPGALHYRVVNSDLQVTRSETSAGTLYSLQGERIQPVSIEDDTPSWYSPWGDVYFSELDSWQQVVRWSEPLYHDVIASDEAIRKRVAGIQQQYPLLKDQIAAALRFVQDEVRYLGIEMGQNSHKPSPAAETLARRYGDCKDKTVLLLTLLKELKVEAYPALVNTETRLDQALPSIQAFDHVITYLQFEGKTYWLDPTRSYQHGSIDRIHQPDYHFALVLRPTTRELTPMSPTQSKFGIFVRDRFDLTEGDVVDYTTVTEYYGWNAERQRRALADKGSNKLQQEYLEFFQNYHAATSINIPIQFSDDAVNNRFVTREQYRIENFWEDRPDRQVYRTDFYANIVSAALEIPAAVNRNDPLYLTHPERIEQIIELNFDRDGWQFDDYLFEEDNAYFYFSNESSFDAAQHQLTLTYRYYSKTDHVPADRYQDYVAALKRTENYQSLGIYRSYSEVDYSENHYSENHYSESHYAEGESATNATTEVEIWYHKLLNPLVAIGVLGGLYALIFLLWRIERHRHPDQPGAEFFPVSKAKLITMWICTFGVYGMYWFYRNFLYIKQHRNHTAMPMARGFFYSFWYYPLWHELHKDSERRAETMRLPQQWLAILLALLFVSFVLIGNNGLWYVPSLVLSVLLLLPLADYILWVNQNAGEAVANNSRWSFRHYLLVLISVPVFALFLGPEIGLLPSSTVVKGNRILDYNIKYMQRHGVLKPSDAIDYFYSDALLFIRDDGNGFTQRHVFSYWKDDDDSLVLEQADYSEIADIRVDWQTGLGDNSTVTITKHDGSEFLLYVSSLERKDQLFVAALKDRWQNQRDKANSELRAQSTSNSATASGLLNQ